MRIPTIFLTAAAVALSSRAASAQIAPMEPAVDGADPHAAPTEPPPPDDHGGHELRLGGVLITVAAGSNFVLGALLIAFAGPGETICPGGCGMTGAQKLGIGMTVGGALGLAAGIPVTILGSRRIHRYQEQTTGAVPAVALSPARATFTWSF